MKPAEHGIADQGSEFYIYTPSRTAQRTFLYPMRAGLFHYLPGYRQERRSFDSFLIMAVRDGAMDVTVAGATHRAGKGDFALIDCYAPHAYGTDEGADVLWLHFDGPTARAYYDLIHDRLGSVFSFRDSGYATTRLTNIYRTFHEAARVSEPLMGKYITDVLTEFAIGAESAGTAAAAPRNAGDPASDTARESSITRTHAIEDVLAYIANHLHEPLTVGDLAARAYMSEYHFIRVFKKETGYTPHAYVIDARMHAAEYRLINSDIPLRQLCEECGFTDASTFCAAFRKRTGMSPIEFRRRSAIR
ncbi:AraC family transcriptional regulator [Bifidobacterium samirii]|uniref:Transcriptional regulator, AraC family n=1 Tax=Bifidobacterium samirii TaxID=2306974 RepID=A0A430FWN0_9BIFI|nr:AraC family transcriptional regulator [Bifidobacterium samirii]RSX58525.1 transcriptional regulator, AraC family [Bifidobacterium samirii]